MRSLGRGLALASTLFLAACATRPVTPPSEAPAPKPAPVTSPTPEPQPVPTPGPANALAAGVVKVEPRLVSNANATRALAAFRRSCTAMQTRQDRSGLTQAGDWAAVCAEAANVTDVAAPSYFRDRFDWVRVGTGEAFATGYYEPEILGSRTQAEGYAVPIYAKPADLVRCTRADGTQGRGRLDETGACVAYYSRAEVDDGAVANRGLEIGWAADPVDLFFLEIQGSGRLKLPDGSVMRIGYADQNGREYVAVGRLLRQRELLPAGGATADAIMAWMRAQPDGGRALMRENPSYIFFRELTGPGPLGAMNVAVTPQMTVATDPLFTPLGAPVFLNLDMVPGSELWVAQDTGGAIKGANRFDTFWGAGAAAKSFAGAMSSKGSAIILLPKGTAGRLTSNGAPFNP